METSKFKLYLGATSRYRASVISTDVKVAPLCWRREFRWFGLLLKVIDTVTLSIIKFSILILAQIVENRESRQTGQIAGPRLPAVLYEDLFSS